MSAEYELGMYCEAFHGTAGITASNEMPNITDVTINLETGEADVTTRGNNGWRATAATLKNGSVDFQMIWNESDGGFAAVQTAWANGTPLAMAFFTSAGSGLDADFTITNFTRTEPLEDAVKVQVTAKPTYSTRAPTWVTGS